MKKLLATIALLAVVTACTTGCSGDKSADNSSVSNTTSQTESTNVQEMEEESIQTENSTTTNTESVIYDIEYTPETDFKYDYDSEIDGIRILSYTGSASEVSIPKEIDGKNVIAIGNSNSVFEACNSLTTVVIESEYQTV